MVLIILTQLANTTSRHIEEFQLHLCTRFPIFGAFYNILLA